MKTIKLSDKNLQLAINAIGIAMSVSYNIAIKSRKAGKRSHAKGLEHTADSWKRVRNKLIKAQEAKR